MHKTPPSLTAYAWLSILAAITTMSMKGAAFYLTQSSGLFSDALESLVNLATALAALIILRIAARPADDKHHFGHGKAEYFGSAFEGAMIMAAAGGIGMNAWHHLSLPHQLLNLDTGFAITGAATIINLMVARVLIRAARRHHSIVLEADGKHLMSDVWSSIGVVAGVALADITGQLWMDPAVAILVAANIIWAGLQLISRSVSGLLDSTLPTSENRKIRALLAEFRQEGVHFHDMRTRQSGSQRFMTVHLLVPGNWTVQLAHDHAERIENRIQNEIPNLVVITHIEPIEDPVSFAHPEPYRD
ncbi:MAG: hypothetical protein RIQ52_60 [Pseudomonadota bacterium]|jgi:cation diffusion facilitator family transporter